VKLTTHSIYSHVQNEWSAASTPAICLDGVKRKKKLTFLLFGLHTAKYLSQDF
jgi:hypothetical protein